MIFGNMKACAFGDKGDMRVAQFHSGSFGGKEVALANQTRHRLQAPPRIRGRASESVHGRLRPRRLSLLCFPLRLSRFS